MREDFIRVPQAGTARAALQHYERNQFAPRPVAHDTFGTNGPKLVREISDCQTLKSCCAVVLCSHAIVP